MIWRSTYKESLGDMLARTYNQKDLDIFHMLWFSYRIPTLLKSAYFQIFRVGDGYHTLTVQKYINGQIKVKFSVNRNYGNKLETFTQHK